MNRDNLITLAIFSIFITAPFLSVALELQVEKIKLKINKRLAKHGLRLKERV